MATLTPMNQAKSDIRRRKSKLSIDSLDLMHSSPLHTLASLRSLVLSYLTDLENTLTESCKLQGEHTLEDAKQSAQTALDMLEGIRADVYSHLPDPGLIKSRLQDMPEVPTLNEMRSHLPDIQQMRSHLPDMAEMRAHYLPDMPSLPDMDDVISDMRLKLDDVRSRFNELDFHTPFNYIPTLSRHLQNLHSYLSSMDAPSSGLPSTSFAPNTVLSNLLESLLNSEIVKEISESTPEVVDPGACILDRTAIEVAETLKRSLHGVRLVKYADLPYAWQNSPFVTHGYRFIPLDQWPLVVKSVFKWHNETLNIHTHLIPLLIWTANLIPVANDSFAYETPEVLFMTFALLCLLLSTVWHTMSGCAHRGSVEMCARADYVGIGWLISASAATVVHYGFDCHPGLRYAFLGFCFTTGVAGTIFPFVKWFNRFEYRMYRISFFVALAFAGFGPVMVMAMLFSIQDAFAFISPIFPSLLSYIVGLCFYASHFPERILSKEVNEKLNMFGGSSHAIWHCFIVLAVHQHKAAMGSMRTTVFQCMADGA